MEVGVGLEMIVSLLRGTALVMELSLERHARVIWLERVDS